MCKKFLNNNKEIIYRGLFFLIGLSILIYFKSNIYDCFVEKDVNRIMIDVGIGLIGFLITAYTVFLGFEDQISKKMKDTSILDKIEFRFRISIYLNLLLLILGLIFIFLDTVWVPPIILSLFLLLLLFLIMLLGYLKILFDDVRRKK